jgi:hypothetical protein
VPEEDLWKSGWFGLGGASECRDPEIDRTWLAVKGALFRPGPDIEFERFIADAGCGMFEL